MAIKPATGLSFASAPIGTVWLPGGVVSPGVERPNPPTPIQPAVFIQPPATVQHHAGGGSSLWKPVPP